ncbi:cysteine desulfurase family protein [Sulfitobacter sp. 20_GPM-1509m]|uniref:cysteine desulfurase family protein n=1 Tax=Sulfitobacter sp. 20_GPM-1509m TaxID=1380367 RepID=UPI00048C7B64|nr:cysteine desulfurase family protein [Sulfitobacter sp. 20_GPM-1509m]
MTRSTIYLDHNASTPVDEKVIDKIVAAMRELPANPSSVDHREGAAASAAVEEARERVAKGINARSADIIFVSGATEANNLAIVGTMRAQNKTGRTRIVTIATEHPSVLEAARNTGVGNEIVVLPVDDQGRIDLNLLESELKRGTALVSSMAANNETGVCHPLSAIGRLCEKYGALFHCDLTQLTAYHPIDVQSSNIHLASLSGHKMYGPKGTGALYCRRRRPHVALEPILRGGGQERGLRSGTLNTSGIVGLAAAFELREPRLKIAANIADLRNALERRLVQETGAFVNGGEADRLPNTLNLSIPGIEPLALMRRLSGQITFSSSSACSTQSVKDSHVLEAMFGANTERTKSAFRLGLGFGTTKDQVETAAELFIEAVSGIRQGRVGSAA